MLTKGMRTNIISKIIQTHTNTIDKTIIIFEVLFIPKILKSFKTIGL